MLEYRQGEVKRFLLEMRDQDDWLAFAGFPPAYQLQALFGNDHSAPILSPSRFKESLVPFVTMYLRKGVAEAYNKTKHGYQVVRSEFALSDDSGSSAKAQGDSIFIVLDEKTLVSIPVSNKKANHLANVYLENIETNHLRVSMLTELIVYCLKQGLPLGRMAEK